jgi:hypothetical protein
MGARIRKSAFWEKSMSITLKMFLIIEQKETASGMQIRMAHPALAEAVLSQILENNKNIFLAESLPENHKRKQVFWLIFGSFLF